MKQHIDPEQLDELTDEQRRKLLVWWNPHDGDYIAWKNNNRQKEWNVELNYCDTEWGYFQEPNKKVTSIRVLPLLSIGQMIEFLGEKKKDIHIERYELGQWDISTCFDDTWHFTGSESKELVDALWEAVKEVLEK